MPYKLPMGADRPGLFVFVLDQSGSMANKWPQSPKHRKADALADVLNNTLAEISARCVKGEGQVSDRCHIAMLGYEGSTVASVWSGPLAGREAVPISEVAKQPMEWKKTKVQVENGAGGLVEVDEDVPVWVKPTTGGGTPMKEALAKALGVVNQWLPTHADCFPPVVIHITDGEPTSGDPSAAGTALRALQTNDGNVLLVNIHIPDGAPVTACFPADRTSLPGNVPSASLLFDMTSEIPAELVDVAQNAGLNVVPRSRLMILNADAIDVIRLIQFATVGTMGANTD